MEAATAAGGTVATAALLGATHAIEPDHVAGITSVTADAADARLSALVGACFALGHVALVAIWIGGGLLLLGGTGFPAVLDTIGTIGLGAVLSALGSYLLLRAAGSLARGDPAEGHDCGRFAPSAAGRPGVRTYLKVGLVGALFTLSPPVATIAFLSGVASTLGVGALPLAMVAYGVAIVGAMTAIGAGAGVAFRATDAFGERARGATRLLAGVLVLGMGLRFLYLSLGS